MLSTAQADVTEKPATSRGGNTLRRCRRIPRRLHEPTAPDHALVRLIGGGDRQAMQLLYSRHNVRVYRFVLRIAGNPCLAEDIVSETFLEVWRCADGFRSKSQVSTWLLAIARNKALAALRRPVDAQLGDDQMAAIEEPADDPEMSLSRKSQGAAIRRCLSQLSPAHREVLDLVYYHEKTVEEVAQVLGSPAGTVKTRMHYARKQMRELLNAAGFDAPDRKLPARSKSLSDNLRKKVPGHHPFG